MNDSFITQFQVHRGERWAGLADEAMLTNALRLEPEKLPQVISYIYGTKYAGYSSAIDMLTGGLGHRITIERPSYEWEILVDDERPVEILQAKNSDGTLIAPDGIAGVGMQEFELTLKEALYGPGAILELDDYTQLRVIAEPVQDGSGWTYRVCSAEGQKNMVIGGRCLQPGCQVSRLGSAYEEGSDEADIISYNTGMKFRNYLSTVRLKIDITGSARADVMAYAMKDPVSGQSSVVWADYQMWHATRQFMERIEYQMMFDRTTVSPDGTFQVKGKTGRPIKRGAGIVQQIAPANRRTYNVLTADVLESFLYDLSYNIIDVGNRDFVLFTGEMGMREIDRALKEKLGTLGLSVTDSHFITGSGSNLVLQGQFSEYHMPNGMTLKTKLLPFLDDPVHNRELHPISNKPLSSYRIYVLDNSFRNGKANIQKIVKKGREHLQWVVPGSCTPSGFMNSTSSYGASSIDGYTVHFLAEIGVVILDPRGCGILEQIVL